MRALSGSRGGTGEAGRSPASGSAAPEWAPARREWGTKTLAGRLASSLKAPWLRSLTHPVAVVVATWGLLVVLFVPAVTQPAVHVVPGQVSPVEVTAPRTIENRYRTAQLQDEAVKEVLRRAAEDPANYSIDPTASVQAGDRVRQAMSVLRAERAKLWGTENGGGGSSSDGANGSKPVKPPSSTAVANRAGEVRQLILAQANLVVPSSAVQAALRLSPGSFDQAADAAPAVVERVMGSTRIGPDGVGEARARLAAEVDRLNVPDDAKALATAFASAA
ncbi:MAG: hypothetical protein AB1609_22860, partial [Bacillota bacterium]